MSGCDILSLPHAPGAPKACSGKCMNACGGAAPPVWVLAACEGRISLFSKSPDGALHLLPQDKNPVASSIASFRTHLAEEISRGNVAQLVLVGGANDLSWAQMALPETAAGRVVAEIEYPLLPGWFRQSPDLKQLTQAIEQLFRA